MDEHADLIQLKDVTFTYGQNSPVLENFSFALTPGERIGLVGPNGSGKTTLFHIIMGLRRPQNGDVIVFGKPRAMEKDFFEVREKIGLLFQDPENQLFSPTVAEDVAFGPLNLGKSRSEALEIVRETLDVLGLSELENRITHHLSGGEKRLVSLATVLAMKPEVLLLDEPEAGLDEKTSKRITELLAATSQARIVISHDRDFLSRVTDSIYSITSNALKAP